MNITNENRRDANPYTDAELMDAIGQLHAAHCAIGRQMMALMAEYEAREAYKADGAASMTTWVAAFTGASVRTADSWVRTGAALTSLPHIAEAHGAGELSFDQARSLAAFATPDDDEELAEVARGHSAAALERMARAARTISDDEVADARRRRSLTWRYNEDSHSLRLSGWLFDADGATVVKCLERMASRAPKDPVTDTYRPFDARCADALVELCGSELQDDQDAERATVVVHVDADEHARGYGSATIEGGPMVSMGTARRLSCDGNIETITEDERGKPVTIGRRSRKVAPYMMRALRHRDDGCRFPGCGRKRWLHAHHVRHWAQGGETNLENLVLLCGFHHRLVHEAGWKMRGDPFGRLTFERPDGRSVGAGPPCLREEVAARLGLGALRPARP